jgi:Zn ribbon nucleic-acid-binding protein
MVCPKCGYKQYCPCPSCKNKLPLDKKVWIWHDNDLVECGNCGFTAHCDWWMDEEYRQMKEDESKKDMCDLQAR